MKIKDISEREWIELARTHVDKAEELSQDDDAFAIAIDRGFLVSNIDGFIPSTDKPERMPWLWVGYKACIAAMSDVIAKGAKPIQVIVSLTFPQDFEVEDSMEILRGISLACKETGSKFQGGDLNLGGETVIDVAVNGLATDKIIKRHANNLEIGDKVYWIGPPFGSSARSLRMLLSGNYSSKEEKDLIEPFFFKPKSQLDFLEIAQRFQLKSSMDCSDGLALTLCSLTDGTGLGVKIDERAIRENSLAEPSHFINDVFYGGEEYGIVFISSDQIEDALQIGQLVEGSTSFGEIQLECRGWDHFA